MRIRALIAGALALAAAVTVAVSLVAPDTARACTCENQAVVVTPDGTEKVVPYPAGADQAEVAFVGRPISEEEIGRWEVAVVLEVDWVYKGDVGPRIEILTDTATSCSLFLAPQRPTGLLAHRSDDGRLGASVCSVVSIDALENAFGAGYPTDSSIRLSHSDRGSGLSPTLVLVISLVLAVAITLPTLWLLGRRRRARHSLAAQSSEEET